MHNMAGKSQKNPLLTGAGISFPFENFTNSTLLVPVPQTEAPLIPEEIEADSFLGQEPQRSGSTSSFKAAPISKSHSTQSLSLSESSLSSGLRSHFPSEPQLHTPVPEFTKSFTAAANTAKPTPVYADALHTRLAPLKPPTAVTSSAVQPPPSSVLFSNQVPANFTVPAVLAPPPPALGTSSSTSSGQYNHSNQGVTNSSTPSVFPQFSNASITTSSSHTLNNQSSSSNNSAIFTPIPLPLASNTSPTSFVQIYSQNLPNISTPSIFTPLPTPVVSNGSAEASSPNLCNLSNPSILTTATIQQPSVPSSAPEVPSAPASQSFFSYFSSQKPSQPSNSTPSPSLSNPPASSPLLTNSSLSNSPSTHGSSPPTLPPETAALPPLTGGQQNSYRRSNIKRPTYTRPPELSVTPMATMPSPIAPGPLPTTQPATLFTPSEAPSSNSDLSQASTVFTPASAPPQAAALFTPTSTPTSAPSQKTALFTPTSAPTFAPPQTTALLTPTSAPPQAAALFTPTSAPTSVPPQTTVLFTPTSAPPQERALFTHTSAPIPHPNQATNLFSPTLVPTLSEAVDSPAVIDTPAMPAPPQMSAYKFSSQAQASSSAQPSVLPPSFANLAQGNIYRPVYHHWFYKKVVEGKVLWNPFSMPDSLALEEAFTSPTISAETHVPTDGARYDVEVLRRRRRSLYWEEEPGEVRRCSWFVKGSMDARYVPYDENISTMLEEEYRIASTTNEWNRRVALPDGETIILHSPHAISHHTRSTSPDAWGNSPQMQQKPRVVKRGMDEFDISEGEPETVDHLLFLVHGIGKFCDMKFRPITEVVDDFRSVSLQLIQSHFREAVEGGRVGRVEVLPVSWHQALHSSHIDQRLGNITLSSIPRLRHFTNDTLLDILFYTSPVFCQTIVQAVGNEMNRLYELFLSRNPSFQGGVSLGGHSLGSLILFDMLCHQVPESRAQSAPSTPSAETKGEGGEEEVKTLGQKAQLSRSVSYLTIGTAGTGQPYISYPQLSFKPKAFFALGSPIGMFVTVRGVESLGEDFALPTCPLFFNIFHPFDPVAYRIESLINTDFKQYSPVLIPHHKGRKRMHLELKDTLEHVGAALKQRLSESLRSTWNTVCQTVFFNRSDSTLEQEVNKVIEKEILQSCGGDVDSSQAPAASNPGPDVKIGRLNQGRRVDYVLQEAPLESFNEYLFALSSHVCYWESEDTMLMMLKEIYATMGVTPDSQVVQQILPFEPPAGVSSSQHYIALPSVPQSGGMDPTAPMSDNTDVGQPPLAGFFRE